MAHTFELESTRLVKKGGTPTVLSYIVLKHFKEHEDGNIQVSFDCANPADMEKEIDRLVEELKEFKVKVRKLYAK